MQGVFIRHVRCGSKEKNAVALQANHYTLLFLEKRFFAAISERATERQGRFVVRPSFFLLALVELFFDFLLSKEKVELKWRVG